MKERPILFSSPMVRALLDGSKTQTRRIVKCFQHFAPAEVEYIDCVKDCDGLPSRVDMIEDDLCPYGQIGDQLWVRETFFHIPDFHGEDCTWYRADAPNLFAGSWKPSIFMRRAYSRIKLEITGVRVERLNDCSEADAVAEGIQPIFQEIGVVSAKDQYIGLWESINGDGSWAKNPWVWVIEFKRA